MRDEKTEENEEEEEREEDYEDYSWDPWYESMVFEDEFGDELEEELLAEEEGW
ncbi:MAG: hypothetical protein QXH81_09255 [Thermofilaceae archaeon]